MTKTYRLLWKSVASATDGARALRILIEGGGFGQRKSISVSALFATSDSSSGYRRRNLKPAERQAFFVELSRLAKHHGTLLWVAWGLRFQTRHSPPVYLWISGPDVRRTSRHGEGHEGYGPGQIPED